MHTRITACAVERIVRRRRYDRAGEEHYNIISALHKSMRGGDPDAALYWLARMLEAGEDARSVLSVGATRVARPVTRVPGAASGAWRARGRLCRDARPAAWTEPHC